MRTASVGKERHHDDVRQAMRDRVLQVLRH
jgi:hypothetical protein